jgi:hypothetical protein
MIRRLPHIPMKASTKTIGFAAIFLAAIWLCGCGAEPGVTGVFEQVYTVNGPVHLEMANGSGDVHVSVGVSNQVHVHGEIHAHDWGFESSEKVLDELKAHPPVSQEGNLIRIGQSQQRFHNVSIDFTIEVPPETEIHGATGSGDVEFVGIHGPANFNAGSGNVTARSIASDVQIKTGSGDVKLVQVQGQVQVTAGSGDIQIDAAKGAIRLGTGSGDIEISQPGDNVVAETGSGDIVVNDATADLRLHSGSGEITVGGNPGESNYWDLHSASGNVTLDVPQSASFRLYAHTSSGDINAEIPVVMEGTAGKHELRARIGDGKARVEIETSSGTIDLK